MMKNKEVLIVSPFEIPNVRLALQTLKSGAFPILHLGRNKKIAINKLKELSEKTSEKFGISGCSYILSEIEIPTNVSKVITPYISNIKLDYTIDILYQVFSFEEAELAIKNGVKSIIIKGNEGSGKVSYESSFILFQNILKKYPNPDFNIYVQGGFGVHTSAAALALGAHGVIFDSQVALFPESNTPENLKNILSKLSGSETIVVENYRFLSRKNSPKLPESPTFKDVEPFIGGLDIESNLIPLGQDIALAVDYLEKYKKLDNFVFAVKEATYGHLLQAQKLNSIEKNSPLAKELKIKYPIAQGPMARVSDIPEFAEKVANEGAIPFIAMSLMIGNAAKNAVKNTYDLLKDKPWGVGILGFAPSQIREEQMKYILENKPPVVIIAGGRPSLAKPYEKEGIKAFLHVPSVSLLDLFLKEGAKNFIFEGRESGGHVGPLASLVLWEKQIFRLLKEEQPSLINVFFAGGIHDSFSSAFVSIMSASLAAKGVKIGILMGSSYLFTKEAVDTGAISKVYQQESINLDKTILLEAAAGQETRALPTPFTEEFLNEKKRLIAQGLDSKEVWLKLEEMNLGRQRISAKGIERKGDKLVELNHKEQLQKGVFMIGAIASLRNKALSIKDLHKEVAVDNNTLISNLSEISKPANKQKNTKLAIVGMAGIFPKAKDLDEYWKNILLGEDCITEVPNDRWNKDLFYNPNTRDTDYISSKWGGFIPTIDFDPLEFGIPPQSLASIEPVQLLSLLVAKRAFEDAGYDMKNFDGENTSVIIGAEGATELASSYGFRGYAKQVFGELPEELKQALPKLNEDSFPGVLSNVVAGRITNRLNLGGCNYTVDAACASSLAAMDIACQELQSNRSDIVLVGGADLHNGLNDFLMFSATHALSRKGKCASFDADSDGIALGEGIAMLVLKRLEDAEQDGDRIYAVIRGTGGSSDGKSLGMTAPNKKGQMKALQRAYKNSGVLPSEVGLIEAHGTGTVVGDRTELNALTDMFLESGAQVGQTHLGSVKTQIGHTKCSAGIAGVIKAALSTYYGIKPPTINLKKPNTYYNQELSPFVFNTQAGLWNDDKRISGISAFGFGGTNFHVVIENYQSDIKKASALNSWPSELFIFRGDHKEEALLLAKKIKTLLNTNKSLKIKDIAYSLATYNQKEIQFSIIAQNIEELDLKIDNILLNKEDQNIYLRKEIDGKVAFLFSGQGSQRVNMARDLFVAFPSMRKLLNQNREYEKILFPHTVFDNGSKIQQNKIITDTRNTQPTLGIVDLAIAEFLNSLGITPDVVAGHSYGELPALCFAGVFDSEKLVYLSKERAESILKAIKEDKGKMIVTSANEEELSSLLKDENEIWAVNYNSQKQIILAGSTSAVAKFIEKAKENKISCKELTVDCAFHSPLLKDAEKFYSKILKDIKFKEPKIPVWSNTTAEEYPSQETKIKERLSEHLIKPVLFTQEVNNLYNNNVKIFIETGPGRVLTNLVQTILGKEDIVTIQTEEKGKEGISFLLQGIAQYISTGRNINLEKLFEDREVAKLKIDEPEFYKNKPTNWLINGHYAVPSIGELPANGALPIVQPLNLLGKLSSQNYNSENLTESDHIMLEYLGNMKSMIQNQRDVMLGYLGQDIHAGIRVESKDNFQKNTIQYNSGNGSSDIIESPQNNAQDLAPAKSSPSISLEIIQNTLLETVSEKTGYPVEMLGLDLDLEADLSIDSIKRMEIIGALKEKLNITADFEESEDAIEKMASIKTLSGVIGWVEELVKEEQNSKHIIDSSNSNHGITQSNQGKESISLEIIKSTLLDTVSEKTGYPVDMLGLDLDLEADLSIDSIKRMEIIGALKEKLNITADFEESEDAIEKMASIKTLNGVIGWVEELVNEDLKKETKVITTQANSSISTISFDAETIAELESDLNENNIENEPILRTFFELKNYPIDSKEKLEIANKYFALTDQGDNLSKNVKKLLEEKGAFVDFITGNENDLSKYDGLLIFKTNKSSIDYTIEDVFHMIKKLNMDKVQWIYLIEDIMAGLEKKQSISEFKILPGYSGFIKSLAREYSKINCRIISSLTNFDEYLPTLIYQELEISDISAEVFYKNKDRYRLNLIPEKIQTKKNSKLELDTDSVVLVLGGAQGITAELTEQLSTEYPCNYILVGRSKKPTKEDHKYISLNDKNEIRKFLISNEGMKIPAEIEKKAQMIDKTNQIIKTISQIESSGSKVTYFSLDVTNDNEFKKLIKNIYKQYGKIDGVIHAAGILEDKLFSQKTYESFEKVYTTKIKPLHVLLDELKDNLKFMVFFSSIASVYGNRGQIDYAAANSIFDRISLLSNNIKDIRILTINWGPWKGTGMVSSALEAEFKKRGVGMIPLKQGGKEFVNELKYGTHNQVLVMGGNEDEVKQFFGI
ncbi:SDR family NAD(P)-dependent oxidoreductase [Apibacter muscae]|nr:SDR family NAD(P)-dependent oxidoreductase [Apibacter muscae]